MANPTSQVASLKQAIVDRARELSAEHVRQGQMTRNRIMDDARDKVKLMEQKELLAAKENAERMYHRRVQASEIKLQAEMDRNRWGLVQSVMDEVQRRVAELVADRDAYDPVFRQLLLQGIQLLGIEHQVAKVNHDDRQYYQKNWDKLVGDTGVNVELSDELCPCVGGVRLYSIDGEMLVDNTFDGIIERRHDALMRLVFERLFSKVPSMGVSTHG